jgi:hypothetical protein
MFYKHPRHWPSKSAFLKLSAIAYHFIGGRRTRGSPIFLNTPPHPNCKQVNRGRIIPLVKLTKTVLTHTHVWVYFLFAQGLIQFFQCFSSETACGPPGGPQFDKHCSKCWLFGCCCSYAIRSSSSTCRYPGVGVCVCVCVCVCGECHFVWFIQVSWQSRVAYKRKPKLWRRLATLPCLCPLSPPALYAATLYDHSSLFGTVHSFLSMEIEPHQLFVEFLLFQ